MTDRRMQDDRPLFDPALKRINVLATDMRKNSLGLRTTEWTISDLMFCSETKGQAVDLLWKRDPAFKQMMLSPLYYHLDRNYFDMLSKSNEEQVVFLREHPKEQTNRLSALLAVDYIETKGRDTLFQGMIHSMEQARCEKKTIDNDKNYLLSYFPYKQYPQTVVDHFHCFYALVHNEAFLQLEDLQILIDKVLLFINEKCPHEAETVIDDIVDGYCKRFYACHNYTLYQRVEWSYALVKKLSGHYKKTTTSPR